MSVGVESNGDCVREVLILVCFGIGHYNPCMQLARACLEQASANGGRGARVTMVVPLQQEHLSCILEQDEEFKPIPDDWTLRSLPGRTAEEGVFQWIRLNTEANAGDEIFQWFTTHQMDWVPDIKRFYANRQTRPDVIFADIAVLNDIPLADHFRCPSYNFFPSPLFFYNLMPTIHQAALAAAATPHPPDHATNTSEAELAQTKSAEAGDSSCCAGEPQHEVTTTTPALTSVPSPVDAPLLELPGFQGLKIDLLREGLVQEGTDTTFMRRFLEATAQANSRRAGVVCNDVRGFYGNAAIEAAKNRPEFEVLPVGPLALRYDTRIIPAANTLCRPEEIFQAKPTRDPLLLWLDHQPDNSVIYISMGSSFDLAQRDLFELASAITAVLEDDSANKPAGVVWAHRPTKKRLAGFKADESGLPLGWREQHSEQVKVIRWVNQLAVLKHRAVGLFVTHSGWNGLLEALSVGHAPLLMLPVAAEQPGNAKLMEGHYRVGERLWTHPTLGEPLERTRVAGKIRQCFKNPEYAANVRKMNDICGAAWKEGGSSRAALRKLLS